MDHFLFANLKKKRFHTKDIFSQNFHYMDFLFISCKINIQRNICMRKCYDFYKVEFSSLIS